MFIEQALITRKVRFSVSHLIVLLITMKCKNYTSHRMTSMSYVKRIMVREHRVARVSLTEFVELSRFAEFKLHIAAA